MAVSEDFACCTGVEFAHANSKIGQAVGSEFARNINSISLASQGASNGGLPSMSGTGMELA